MIGSRGYSINLTITLLLVILNMPTKTKYKALV